MIGEVGRHLRRRAFRSDDDSRMSLAVGIEVLVNTLRWTMDEHQLLGTFGQALRWRDRRAREQ